MEESSQRPLHTSFSSFSCTSLEVKANWGGGFDVLRGIPWHMSFPVQGVLGIRVPWTLTVELLSPVFLLPPQSLLTGEIMDGTRFWGLAQCLSWAVLQRGLWAASCSLFGCFFFFFKQRREGMISVWLGFFFSSIYKPLALVLLVHSLSQRTCNQENLPGTVLLWNTLSSG